MHHLRAGGHRIGDICPFAGFLKVRQSTVEHLVGRIEEVNIAYAGKISPGAGEHIVRHLLAALGKIPVKCAVIDAGITPYQMPLILRRLACLRDFWGFSLITKSRKILEAAYPPERWTLPGCDPVKEYDALAAYLKTYSKHTIRNIFWSANNYALPPEPAETGCRMIYWYGEEEKKARRSNIRFIKRYFPQMRIRGIPKMDHAELVMMYPQEFCRYMKEFLNLEE